MEENAQDEGIAMMEMPRYRSHKEVWGLKIAGIQFNEDRSAIIAPKDEGYSPFKVAAEWAERFKGSEDDLGYYVVYKDGYASWSPTEAFEGGYTRI